MKKFLFVFAAFLAFSTAVIAQVATYQLSSHILDITAGQPAADVKITLSKQSADQQWVVVDEKRTDANGRIKDFLKQDGRDHRGIYKLTFYTSPYFKARGQATFYPFVEVVFELADNEHYHVPITLSPYGYATYRGN